MATEVLRPHDCLVRPVPSFRNPNPNPNPRPRKRREGSPRPPAKSHRQQQQLAATTVAACHVIILKRGDPLLDANAKTTTTKKEMERKKRTGSDPAVPVIPRQLRLVAPAGPAGDVYAGSAFSMSPSPRKVPLPSFSRRREVDRSATEDLRRLLRLD